MAVTIQQVVQWKQQGRPIVDLTTWDYTFAQVLNQALDVDVQDCNNAIQRLSRKSSHLVALFRAVTGFLSH